MPSTKYKEGDSLGPHNHTLTLRGSGNNSTSQFSCSHCHSLFNARIAHIVRGNIQSCGCQTNILLQKAGAAGKTHGLYKHKVYKVWQHMKSRCLNSHHTHFSRWGGRGISIHPLWVDNFKAFYNYVTRLETYPGEPLLGRGASKYTLDRVENNGNYEPGNLRWATPTQQANNRRISKEGGNSE